MEFSSCQSHVRRATQVALHQVDHSIFFEVGGDRYVAWLTEEQTEAFEGQLSAMGCLACELARVFSPPQGCSQSSSMSSICSCIDSTDFRMRFDVPGIFTRDLKVLADFATEWYAADLVAPVTKGLPRKLVFLTDNMPTDDTPQKQAVMSVVHDLEAYFGIEAISVSLKDLWNSSPPEDAKGEKLYNFLIEVGASTFLYKNYHSGADFWDEYRKTFQKNPFVSDSVQWRWKIGMKYTQEQYNEGIRRLDIYKQWWLDSILETKEKDTLVVMQSEDVKPDYRDDRPPDYYIQPALHQWWVSSILGAPEVVVPADQIPYISRITGVKEQLPVMASLLSQPDSDLDLLRLTRCFFEHAGRAAIVKSGRVIFEVGDDQPLPSNSWV